MRFLMACSVLAASFLACHSVSAQSPPQENPYGELSGASGPIKAPTGPPKPTPRTSGGKPDLSGFWKGPLIFGGMFKAVGGPPFTPAGEEACKYKLAKSINQEALGLFAGIPRASISGVPFEIVQNSNRIAFLYELMWTFRTVPIGGRGHQKDFEPSFFGAGVAEWDGDTLVIDSVGFKDKRSWIDDDANPHSEDRHFVE